jgi:hypothetical protein
MEEERGNIGRRRGIEEKIRRGRMEEYSISIIVYV